MIKLILPIYMYNMDDQYLIIRKRKFTVHFQDIIGLDVSDEIISVLSGKFALNILGL